MFSVFHKIARASKAWRQFWIRRWRASRRRIEGPPRFDQAVITPEAYWTGIVNALSRRLPDDVLRRLTEIDNTSWSRPNLVMTRWASALRAAGIRTAVLSNMPISVRSHLRSVKWMPQFDYSCYSCDVRCAKPEPAIHRDF